MRKKLSLFLVMLMALTMVLGTGITAMAAEPPEGAPLSVRPCTQQTTGVLWYVTRIEGDNVYVLIYNIDGSYIGSAQASAGAFLDSISVGRVYHSIAGGRYCLCGDNLPLDPIIAECGNNEHQYMSHFYSYGKLNSDGDKVIGAYYYRAGELCSHNDNTLYPVSLFDGGNFGEGWYSLNGDGSLWISCSGPHGITPVNPYASAPQSTASAPSCDHDFQWQTITSATATTYGTEGEVCSKCGATRNVRVKSPLDDWVRMQINNVKPGDVLKFDFGPWNSYPLWMMQMIADKPTVTYIFNYTYQGNKYEVTIKPGDKFALDCDWYGPLKMPTLFDTVITKW